MFGQVSDKNVDTASQLFYSNNVFINRDVLKKPYKFEKENHSQWLQLISAIPRPWIYIYIYIYKNTQMTLMALLLLIII